MLQRQTMLNKRCLLLLISIMVVTIIIVGLNTAKAHKNATGLVKERMDFMKSLGDASKQMAKMLKNKTAYDAEKLLDYARSINDHSKRLLDYFPPDSLQKPTEALAAIWDNWADFQKRNQALQNASAKLLTLVQRDDRKALRKQFAALAKTCKSCHKDYRKKKQ